MAVGSYVCKKCSKTFHIRDSDSYKTDFYIMIFLSVFVTIFIVSIPLLVITLPIAFFFYYKQKKLKGKKFVCKVCGYSLVKTGSIEIEKEELLKEGI